MSYYHKNEIRKGDFAYSYGRFYAGTGRVERVEGPALRSMFLPTVTREGRRQLDTSSGASFVQGQLIHYGVQFDESNISGCGTLLMKKVL